mmetsp:Transcript_1153/g.1625  ORF Transcript_1153/g.1625 Transcript_1153/m.1625 type:complete len:764 (+) Transcript_1153:118-2409(+)
MFEESKGETLKENLIDQDIESKDPENPPVQEVKGPEIPRSDESVEGVAENDEESQEDTRNFREKNGYDWDMVMIFNYPGKKSKEGRPIREMILEKLKKGGIETFQYFSVQRDEVICKLRCPLDRLKVYADQINYKFLLDEDKLKEFCNQTSDYGKYDDKIGKIDIADNPKITKIRPYQFCYGRFENGKFKAGEDGAGFARIPLELYKSPEDLQHPFTQVHRIKLITALIEQKESLHGCGISWQDYLHAEHLKAFFPLHNEEKRTALKKKWIPGAIKRMFSFQPIDDIKDYLGEKVGLYFAFLGHYTTWLFPLSLVGLALVVWDVMELTLSSSFSPYFCIFVAFWSILMLEYWKRQEATLVMEWGMTGFQKEELVRPEFYGEKIQSFIDGKQVLYFDKRKRSRFVAFSQTVVISLILVVIAAVGAIYFFKSYMAASSNAYLSDYSSYIASILNSVQIQIMNVIYSKISIGLNKLENHRTNTEYENALIAKTFLFQFVNSYASFFYIAFIKGMYEGCTTYGGSCMNELAISLGIIFGVRLVANYLTEVTLPRIMAKWRRHQETKGAEDKKMSVAEEEMILNPSDSMMLTLKDYSELSIQFGYVTLFVTAFPAAPLLAWLANIMGIGIKATKNLDEYQRVMPHGAQDIGTWYAIFEVLSTIAVVTNAGLVAFTSGVFDLSTTEEAWLFIGGQYTVFIIMFAFAQIIPDVPFVVEIQNERTKFITSKVLDRIPDDEDDPELDNLDELKRPTSFAALIPKLGSKHKMK